METRNHVRLFEERRPALLALAYRMLGTRADAEDAVQDTFIKWQDADRAQIDNPAAWLTTTCTRRCIDLLRSAHRSRVDYVGPWLPEPIHTRTDDMSADEVALASSLSTAFLLLLERLTPKERAAYLLYEIFDMPYGEIAKTLEMQEAPAASSFPEPVPTSASQPSATSRRLSGSRNCWRPSRRRSSRATRNSLLRCCRTT